MSHVVLYCTVLCRAVLSQAFKSAERRIIEAQVLQELDLDRSALDQLPRNIKEACWKGGVPAMRKAGLSQARLQRLRGEQPSRHAEGSSQLQEQQQHLPADAPGEAAGGDSREGGIAMSSSSTSSSDSQAEYGPYFKRQYLFIAATMPALTKGDVGVELQKRFPGALWVSGDMLHQVCVGLLAPIAAGVLLCVAVCPCSKQHRALCAHQLWPRQFIWNRLSQLLATLYPGCLVLYLQIACHRLAFRLSKAWGWATKATCLDSVAAAGWLQSPESCLGSLSLIHCLVIFI